MPKYLLRVAVAVALVAGAASTSGCSDSGEEKTPKAGGTEGAPPLKWKDCEAPTTAEGADRRRPRTGSAPRSTCRSTTRTPKEKRFLSP